MKWSLKSVYFFHLYCHYPRVSKNHVSHRLQKEPPNFPPQIYLILSLFPIHSPYWEVWAVFLKPKSVHVLPLLSAHQWLASNLDSFTDPQDNWLPCGNQYPCLPYLSSLTLTTATPPVSVSLSQNELDPISSSKFSDIGASSFAAHSALKTLFLFPTAYQLYLVWQTPTYPSSERAFWAH